MTSPSQKTSHDLEPKDFKENRRAEPRVRATRKLDILPCQASVNWSFITAELLDCSRRGIAIILPTAPSPQSQFLVKLRLTRGITMLLYTVHNCTPIGETRYRVGARFSGFIAEELRDDPEKIMEALLKGE